MNTTNEWSNEMHMNAKHARLALITTALLTAVALGGCGKGEGPSAKEKGYEAIVAEGTAPARPFNEVEWDAAIEKWSENFKANPTKGLDVNLACADMRRPLIKAFRQAQNPDDKKQRASELEAFWENRGEIKAKCLVTASPERFMPDGWENDEALSAAAHEWKRVREERIEKAFKERRGG